MKILSLFSGIGGFELAASMVWGADLEIIAMCEIDPWCQKVLRHHWPDVPIISDIRSLNAETLMDDTKGGGRGFREAEDKRTSAGDVNPLGNAGSIRPGRIDLLTGGPPCQPASVAGKRRGKEDDRWLWGEAIRVIAEFKPTWVIYENPTGLLTLESGLVFDDLLTQVEAQGYEVQPFIIPACAVNAPHRRDRVWIVAYSQDRQDNGRDRGIVAGPEGQGRGIDTAVDPGRQDVADNEGLRPQGIGAGGEQIAEVHERQAIPLRDGGNGTVRLPEPRLGLPLNGLPDMVARTIGAWADGTWEDGIPRVAKGVPERVNKLKGLGNAIVPQVAAVIMQAIKQIEEKL